MLAPFDVYYRFTSHIFILRHHFVLLRSRLGDCTFLHSSAAGRALAEMMPFSRRLSHACAQHSQLRAENILTQLYYYDNSFYCAEYDSRKFLPLHFA